MAHITETHAHTHVSRVIFRVASRNRMSCQCCRMCSTKWTKYSEWIRSLLYDGMVFVDDNTANPPKFIIVRVARDIRAANASTFRFSGTCHFFCAVNKAFLQVPASITGFGLGNARICLCWRTRPKWIELLLFFTFVDVAWSRTSFTNDFRESSFLLIMPMIFSWIRQRSLHSKIFKLTSSRNM